MGTERENDMKYSKYNHPTSRVLTLISSSLMYDHSLLDTVIKEDALLMVSSASLSILLHNSAHDGMSWIRPITCPAVQT
jgi:hypothetical protein